MVNKVYEWFKNIFSDNEELKTEIPRSHKQKRPSHCECKNCNNELDFFSYRCPYCNKFHCPDHRLPEDHNCKNPSSPFGLNMKL